MKNIILYFVALFSCLNLTAQDGSNILYTKTNKLDNTYIGKFAHIDFHNNSFGGLIADTIIINIDNKQIKFVEHRQDNGFNNWFSQQYLESSNYARIKMRIVKSRIDKISKDSIEVTHFVKYYNNDGERINRKTRLINHIIYNTDISELLIEN